MPFPSFSFHRNTNTQLLGIAAATCVSCYFNQQQQERWRGEDVHPVRWIQRKSSMGPLDPQAQRGYGPNLLGQTEEQTVPVKCHVQGCGEGDPRALLSPTSVPRATLHHGEELGQFADLGHPFCLPSCERRTIYLPWKRRQKRSWLADVEPDHSAHLCLPFHDVFFSGIRATEVIATWLGWKGISHDKVKPPQRLVVIPGKAGVTQKSQQKSVVMENVTRLQCMVTIHRFYHLGNDFQQVSGISASKVHISPYKPDIIRHFLQ